MPKYKPVASPAEKISGAEFEAFLERLDLTDADAARLLGVAEGTIKHCRKYGISGYGARLAMLITRYKLAAHDVAARCNVYLVGLPRTRFQAQRNRNKPIPSATLVPPEWHQQIILSYFQEEAAATFDQLLTYFARKTSKPGLLPDLLKIMTANGAIYCDGAGIWQIGKSMEPDVKPAHTWERRP